MVDGTELLQHTINAYVISISLLKICFHILCCDTIILS